MSDVFVARQPIFDRENRLAGYELLYRPTYAAVAAGDGDAEQMTGSLMVDSLLGIGLTQLTGGGRAWVNFSREPLLRHDFDLLDPRHCVIELLETVPCDAETIEACRQLRARGYVIALDDFAGDVDEYAPILRLAQIVKIGVLDESEEQLRAGIARLAPFQMQLLAEKIEDKATYALCRSLGFSLFQGYYFSRPETVRRKDLPGQLAGIARLMQLTLDAESRDADIEREFRADPGLSLKLLKIVNSASSGYTGIESIHHALRLIGRSPLHRWLALLLAYSAPHGDGVSHELLFSAIECGRFCELLAQRADKHSTSGSLFLTGLLSRFDKILGMPLPEMLEQIHVSPDVEAALLHGSGLHAPFLELATNYSDGKWDEAIEQGSRMGLVDHLPSDYIEASAWARDLLRHH